MDKMKRHDSCLIAMRLSRRHVLAAGAAFAGLTPGLPRSGDAAPPRVGIVPGEFQPIPIALPDFVGGGPSDGEAARGVTQVITGDLRRSGLFAPIDPAAYIEKVASFDAAPRFPDWRVLNAQAVV